MKPVYVKKTKAELTQFVCILDDDNEKLSAEVKFDNDIKKVAPKAFMNASGIHKVFFGDKLKTIKTESFKDCENLKVFCCGEVKDKFDFPIAGVQIPYLGTRKSKFTIESFAFSKCKNLNTVILPDCDELVIEKDAFDGCSSLRTVVCFAEKIDFTGNPFESCPDTLTFVGKKKSLLERFARENGYRFIDE